MGNLPINGNLPIEAKGIPNIGWSNSRYRLQDLPVVGIATVFTLASIVFYILYLQCTLCLAGTYYKNLGLCAERKMNCGLSCWLFFTPFKFFSSQNFIIYWLRSWIFKFNKTCYIYLIFFYLQIFFIVSR